jgi:hypothetical protein
LNCRAGVFAAIHQFSILAQVLEPQQKTATQSPIMETNAFTNKDHRP